MTIHRSAAGRPAYHDSFREPVPARAAVGSNHQQPGQSCREKFQTTGLLSMFPAEPPGPPARRVKLTAESVWLHREKIRSQEFLRRDKRNRTDVPAAASRGKPFYLRAGLP